MTTLADLLASSAAATSSSEQTHYIFCKKCRRSYIYSNPNFPTVHTCSAPKTSSSASSEQDQTKKNTGAGTGGSGGGGSNRKQTLDLSKHCGVIIGPSGIPCMRSLTCKSHSMSSKRAIKNRPKDFDILLAEYLQQHPPKNLPKTVTAAVNLELMPKVETESAELSFEQLESGAPSTFPPKIPAQLHCSLERRRSLARFRQLFSFVDRSRHGAATVPVLGTTSGGINNATDGTNISSSSSSSNKINRSL